MMTFQLIVIYDTWIHAMYIHSCYTLLSVSTFGYELNYQLFTQLYHFCAIEHVSNLLAILISPVHRWLKYIWLKNITPLRKAAEKFKIKM